MIHVTLNTKLGTLQLVKVSNPVGGLSKKNDIPPDSCVLGAVTGGGFELSAFVLCSQSELEVDILLKTFRLFCVSLYVV